MAEIDSLEVKIESEAKSALSGLKTLENQLKGIANVLDTIGNSKGLKELSRAAKTLSNSFSGVKGAAKGVSDSIKPQVKNVSKSLNEMMEKYKDLGKGFRIEGDSTAIQKQINSYSNALAKAKLRKEELEAAGKTGSSSYETAIRSTIKYTNVIESLKKQLAELQKKEKGIKGISNINIGGWGRFQKVVSITSEVFSGIKKAAAGTVESVKKIAGAFKSLLSVIKKVSSAVGKMFSGMANVTPKVLSAIITPIKGITSAVSKLKGAGSEVHSISSGFSRLASAAAGLAAAGGIASFAKNAIELGSDITEVENVVDTAFGSMADKAYDFAANASAQFGLSELAAKQYSGTMMAMLKSSGVAQDAAADMSVALSGLAGDLASFYNLDTDEAFYKLRSAIAGETEPMKALGVNMNIVNLEAFAMSQGINKAYSEMTLAEQSILRYNYILAKTGDAQGDFAKTSGAWANQLRLLRLNIQSISAVIGQGLIAAILPAIKVLNKLMEKMMQAAKVFRDFMYVLFGKKIEGSAKGIVNDMAGITDYTADMSGIGDSADNMADGMEDAADGAGDLTASTKKLQKQLALLSFDELNQLPGKLDDLGNLGSSGNKKDKDSKLDDINIGDMSDMFDDLYDKAEIEPVNKWAAAMRKAFLNHDWEGLGKTIAQMTNAGLQKVYDGIKAITPKVESALKAFARTFNSFVKWLDWDLLGRTIGAGVNLITKSVNTLLDPATGIDFVGLGRGLAKGFRGLINEIEWTELGNSIGNYFMVSWRIAKGIIDQMWENDDLTGLNGWQELGRSFGEGVNGIFEKIDFKTIASVVTSGFRGILVSITELIAEIRFDDIVRNVNDGLQVLYDGIKWDTIGGEIRAFTAEVKKAFNDLLELDFGLIGRIIGAGITDIVRAFNNLTGPGGLDFAGLGANISNGFRNLFAEIPWTEFGNALGNGFMIGWRILNGFITNMSAQNDAGLTGWKQLGISLGNTVNGVFAMIDFEMVADVLVGGINGAIEALWNFVDTIEWGDLATNISTGLNKMIHEIHWEDAGIALNNLIGELLGMLLQVAQETHWDELGRNIGTFLSQIKWGEHLGTAWEIVKEVFGGLLEGMKETLPGKITATLVETIGSLKLASALGPTLITVLGAIFGRGGTIAGIIITAGIVLVPAFLNFGKEIMEGLLKGMLGVLVPIGAWIKEHIVDPIVGWVKKLFDIHSPSKVMAEIGGYVMDGMLSGLKEKVGGVLEWFSGLPQSIKDELGNAREWLNEKGRNAVEGIKDGWEESKQSGFLNKVSKIGEEARNSVGDVKDLLRDKGSGIIEGLKSGFEWGWYEFSSTLGGLGQKIRNAIPNLFDVGKSVIKGFSDGFSSIQLKLPHIDISWNQYNIGDASFSVPSFGLNWYAKGGLAYNPSVVGIGEAGPEAILPLENKRTMGMIADRIMSNYSGGGFDKESIVDAIVEGVITAMMMNQSNQPPIRVDSYVELKTENETLARAVAKGQQSIDYRTNPTPQFGY